MPAPRSQRLEQVRRNPLTPPIGGMLGGAALAGAAIAVDAAIRPAPPAIFTVEATQAFLSAVVGATITVTALLFWIRGMLVQLSAGQMSNRVVRWYLEDRFLLDSIGFVIAVFTFTGLQLLALPPPAEGGAPPVGTALAFLLTLAALANIVAAITNSVHATDTGVILNNLAEEARTAIQEAHPDDRAALSSEGREPTDARYFSQHVRLSLIAPRTGWVNDIDVPRLLDQMPDSSMLEAQVRAGSFVPEGHALAHLSVEATLADAEELHDVRRALRDAFAIDSRRTTGQDVEFTLSKIVDVAVATMAPHSADRTSAYEAVRHLGVALRELFTRPLAPSHFSQQENRQLVLRAALGYEDYLRRTFGHLREIATDLPMLGVLLDTLGDLREVVIQGTRDERIDAVDREAHRLLDAVRHTHAPDEERRGVLHLAAQHGWDVHELQEDEQQDGQQDGQAPPPTSPDDISQHAAESS
ncbi:DUF2254 family protein [Egibacter rhizosphaerae]|nr:DUF2254 family protein [Egibacter rhizosphaerae]